MSGRERVAANEKSASAGAGKWAFASSGVLEDFVFGEGTNGGLSGENSGFPFLIVALHMTQQEQSSPARRQHCNTRIRGGDCVGDGATAGGNVFLKGSVRFDQQTANQ